MTRPIRIEYAGALHHITSRGDRQEDIYIDDVGRSNFLTLLAQVSKDYKIAADFEILFRIIEQHKIKTVYLPKVLVKMRLGSTTNKNMANVATQNKEIFSMLRRYYTNFSVIRFVMSKALNRTAQFYYGYKFRFFGQ